MDGDDAWKSFVNWSKIDEWNSTDLTPSLEVYNELCGVWGLFKIGFIDWYDAFPQDTDSYMVELVLDSRITGTRREFPFKDATKHCPCDSSTGQESAARFGQHVVHCVEQSDACTANDQEDDDEEVSRSPPIMGTGNPQADACDQHNNKTSRREPPLRDDLLTLSPSAEQATDLRDVLTPILDLHHTAPSFFHLSGALCRYLVHVLARLWGAEWATLLDLGVDPVPVQSSGLFGEMA